VTVAELVAESRARQGLPATVEDPATIRRLARLVLATTSKASTVSETSVEALEVRRAAVEPSAAA
jgi:hypothetical protein